MSDHQNSTFWIPSLLAVAFLIFGLGIPELGIQLPEHSTEGALAIAVLFVIWAGYLAYQSSAKSAGQLTGGGLGGSASVVGNHSTATGGDGGSTVARAGGAGGSASVSGNNSSARGGRGGNG